MPLLTSLCAIALTGQGAAPSATVPFRIADSAIIVDAAVNGRTVALMFDTGFAGTVDVNDSINIGKVTGSMPLQDFVGTFMAPTVKINTLTMGSKSIDPKGLADAIMSRGDFSASYGMHCDGLMGLDVIKRNITGINYEKGRFEFYPSTVDISKWVPDNKRTFLVKLLPTGFNSLDMAVEAPNGKRMVLALDTGNAFYATTNQDVLERIGLWDNSATPQFMSQSWVASGPVNSWALKLKDMKIFGVPVKSSVWDVLELPASSADSDGTVGFGFLHNFNLIIDFDRRRVWFDNYSGKTADEEMGEPGVRVHSRSNGDQVVFYVTPNSPAEKAGLKKGDVLLAIDGADLDRHLGSRKLRSLLEGPIGSKVKLAVSSQGQVKRFELERAGLYNEVAKP